MSKILCMCLREVCSCCSLTALPGPAWVLLNYVLQRILLISVVRTFLRVRITRPGISDSFNATHKATRGYNFQRKAHSEHTVHMLALLCTFYFFLMGIHPELWHPLHIPALKPRFTSLSCQIVRSEHGACSMQLRLLPCKA